MLLEPAFEFQHPPGDWTRISFDVNDNPQRSPHSLPGIKPEKSSWVREITNRVKWDDYAGIVMFEGEQDQMVREQSHVLLPLTSPNIINPSMQWLYIRLRPRTIS